MPQGRGRDGRCGLGAQPSGNQGASSSSSSSSLSVIYLLPYMSEPTLTHAELPQTGLADIEDLAAVASEFNVRKRMLPTAMLFSVRARSAEIIPSDLFEDPAKLKAKVAEMLSENPKGKDDKFSKITLSLGGAPEL
jgi:hypothetical protein